MCRLSVIVCWALQVGAFRETATLTADDPSDSSAHTWYGSAVATNGDVAVVGAFMAWHETGAAYVYRKDQGFNQTAILRAPAGTYEDAHLGTAVAVSEDLVVVGAYRDDLGTGTEPGTAHIFTPDGLHVGRIAASDPGWGALFGTSLALCGDLLVVGAPWTGEFLHETGAAYLFRRDGLTFTEIAKLLPTEEPSDGMYFGAAVKMSRDFVVVGAPRDDGHTGSVYVFDVNNYTRVQKLVPDDSHASFGGGFAIEGDTLVVGARSERAAYVYVLEDGKFKQHQKILHAGDGFGSAVGLAEDRLVVGAYNDDTNVSHSGASYVFLRNPNGNFTQSQKLAPTDATTNAGFGAMIAMAENTLVIGAFGSDQAYTFEYSEASNNTNNRSQAPTVLIVVLITAFVVVAAAASLAFYRWSRCSSKNSYDLTSEDTMELT